MQSEIKTFTYPNGEIQRVQVAYPENWERIFFLKLSYENPAFEGFCNVYRNFMVPANPWIFGNLVLFRLPDGVGEDISRDTQYGKVSEPLTAAAALLQRGVKMIGTKPVFLNRQAKTLWRQLEEKNCLQVVRGRLPVTTIIPVGPLPGYLSHVQKDAAMKVNGSFFVMDRFDCATVFDHIGTPVGLCVKDGVVSNPPLFGREALIVRTGGSVTVETPHLKDLDIEIGGVRYRHGVNARVYSRPERAAAPLCRGKKVTIVSDRVVAVSNRLRAQIPGSGFVLVADQANQIRPGDKVIYRGMEDVRFGMQVGNSILKDGEKTKSFLSRFYNIYALDRVPFPPCLYPLDFEKARAARIALGADREGRPMLLWAEGAGKLKYIPGVDSCGASLSEMAEICETVGMYNAVNLDGGGSAQILLNNRRSLRISDRKPEDDSDAERAVPLALMVE